MMKKLLILLLLGLLFPFFANASISFVNGQQSGEYSASVANVTTTLNVTSGNLIIIGCRGNSQLPTTASDTLGNKYVLAVATSSVSEGDYGMFYTVSAGSNANDIINCNFAGTTQYRNLTADQFSGMAATTSTVIDVTSTPAFSAGSVVNVSSTAFTTTNANDLIVGMGNVDAAPVNFTTGAMKDNKGDSFTLQNSTSGDSFFGWYATSSVISGEIVGISQSAHHWTITAAAFKAAAAVASTPIQPDIMPACFD